MKKNVLVLTGSPRRNGNSEKMADAFIRGAVAAGHEVHKFNAGANKIGGCKACKKCWSKGEPCIYRDDFDQLTPLLEEAEILVLASPLYWFTLSAQILAPINRFYAYQSDNCQRPLKIRESCLLVCGADEDMQIFDGTIATYKSIVTYMKWKDRGILVVPKVQDKGDIDETEALDKAKALGRSLS